MKKILFVVAAIVAVSLASCGNQVTGTTVANDSDSVVTVDTTADSTVVIDSLVSDTACCE